MKNFLILRTFIVICCLSACKGAKEKTRIPEPAPATSYQLTALKPVQNYMDSINASISLEDTNLVESSGLAFSRQYAGLLYTHEDSKCSNKITVLDKQGKTRGSIWLKGIVNRDWEDIAVARQADGSSYVYVADIGDNGRRFPQVTIYRFAEPDSLQEKMEIVPEQMDYSYPGGPVNAEALLVSQGSDELWVISKEKEGATLYGLKWQAASKQVQVAKPLLRMPFIKVTAADLSEDGTQILVRTKTDIYFWKGAKGTTVPALLATTPVVIPHYNEWQSEGIAFVPGSNGFYCSSEVPKKTGQKPALTEYVQPVMK